MTRFNQGHSDQNLDAALNGERQGPHSELYRNALASEREKELTEKPGLASILVWPVRAQNPLRFLGFAH
jgi:hypothetical protein